MNRLFSYTIPIDDGAAPNPFHALCTLAICKPRIRSTAKPGDWITGLGSKHAPSGDLSGRVVYAMLVKEKITMAQYDQRCQTEWPFRIPDIRSPHESNRLGDCLYDYRTGQPTLRSGVHHKKEMEKDLGGKFVLIAYEFYYFGNNAVALPKELLAICHQNQGHKSNANKPHFKSFVTWVRSLGFAPGVMHGSPDKTINWEATITGCGGCSTRIRAANRGC